MMEEQKISRINFNDFSSKTKHIVHVVCTEFHMNHPVYFSGEITASVVSALYKKQYKHYFSDYCNCNCDYVTHGIEDACAAIIDMSKERGMYENIEGTTEAQEASEYLNYLIIENKIENKKIQKIRHERLAREEIINSKKRKIRELELAEYRKEAREWCEAQK